MEILARIQTYFGINIEDIIQSERSHLPAGSTVIVITSTMSEALINTLARVRRSGHASTILFICDTPAPRQVSRDHYLSSGGEETWRRLWAAYSRCSPEMSKEAESVQGFRL